MALVLAHRFDGIRVTGLLEHKWKRGGNVLLLIPFLLAYACMTRSASVPSRQFQQQVGPPVPFLELLEKGEAHKGERVILGGYILETVNEQHASLLTMLQAPLDSRNRPKSQDLSEGRFLIRTEEFLDPEIYSKGRKLTVGGKVYEVRSQPLGNRSYPYPVIETQELHLWPKETRHIRPYHPYCHYWYYPWHLHPYAPYPWWAW